MSKKDRTPLIDIVVVIEKSESGSIIGTIETLDFAMISISETIIDITIDLKKSILDFLNHEGKNIKEWQNISLEDIEFTYEYSIHELFKVFEVLKIEHISYLTGINKEELLQFASGSRKPSIGQNKKIENIIRVLGSQFLNVAIT